MRRINRNTLLGILLLTSASFFVFISQYGADENDMVIEVDAEPAYIVEKNDLDPEELLEEQEEKAQNESGKKANPRGDVTEPTKADVSETDPPETDPLEKDPPETDPLETDPTWTEQESDVQTVSILAVGDDLIHTQVVKSGKQKDGSYDFSHLFLGVEDEIKAADLAIINQETILCDQELGYTGYPKFGSPYEVGEAIHEAGFDVVLHATNHTADKGLAGVENTIEFWKQYDDIRMVGISESTKVGDRIAIVERNGIKIAILNYTYGLNGLRLPSGYEYLINLMDIDLIRDDIAYAKENSDFVIVCPHWGTEYVYEPTRKQEELTQFFLECGVDLVFGTHPHVLEPVEWVESEDGSHRMLVYYSLGNFISNQDAMARMLGGMAKVTLQREEDDVVIKDAQIEPLVTHTFYDGVQRFTTYPLQTYTEAMAKKHYLNRAKRSTVTLDKLQELTAFVLGDWFHYSKIS